MRQQIKSIIAVIIILAGSAVSVSGEIKATAPLPLAIINGDTISTADLDQMLIKYHSFMNQDEKIRYDYGNLLKQLVNDKLILQEAYALAMDEEDWLVELLNEKIYKLASSKYVTNTFKPDLTIKEVKVREFFDEYYFRLQLRTISIVDTIEAGRIREEIINGADMDSLAREFSIDTKKFKGGLHSLKHYANIENELRDVAVNLKVGEISKIVKYREVSVLIRLEERVEASSDEYPYFQNKIARILQTDKQELLWDNFIDSLKDVYPPKVNTALLDKIKNDSLTLETEAYLQGSDSFIIKFDDDFGLTDISLRKAISYAKMTNNETSYDSLFTMELKDKTTNSILSYSSFKAGYFDSSEIVEQYNRMLDSALLNVYLNDMVVEKIKFVRAEFEEYYKAHPEKFQSEQQYQIEQLQLSTKDSADMVLRRLNEGASFNYMMKTIDPDNNSSSTGNRWTTMAAYPGDAGDHILSQKKGEHTHLVPSANGWMIYYVKNIREGGTKSLEDSEKQLRKIIFDKKFAEFLDTNLNLLKENSEIIYFDENIENYFKN